mgnify:FL=1
MPITIVHPNAPHPTRWRSYKRGLGLQVPRHWQAWLGDKGSLTKRLIKASAGNFSVSLVSSRLGTPTPSEARALGLKARQQAIIREVELSCHGQTWVCARSIIPHATLIGRLRRLKAIGNKPLGAMLFNHPNMKRGALEVACLKQQSGSEQHWARRSVFYLDGKGVLVCEVFMPPMAHITPQDA